MCNMKTNQEDQEMFQDAPPYCGTPKEYGFMNELINQ